MEDKRVYQEPKIVTILDTINRQINRLFVLVGCVLIVLMLVFIFQDVIRRYFFNDPTVWALDVSRFLMVYVVFLALAPALQGGNHVSTDMVVSRLSARSQYYLKLLTYLLCLIFGAFLFWKLTQATIKVFEDNSLFPVTIKLPMKYIYIAGPIGTIQFMFTSIVCFLTCFYRERPHHVGPSSKRLEM